MRYLLDTNTISYAYRNQGECRQKIEATPVEQICISSVSYFELAYGMALIPRSAVLEAYIQGLRLRYRCMDLDVASAERAGQLRALLRLAGTQIGEYDLLIAGIAMANKLTLVTHNTSEFSRVPGLQVEDWYA
jgi:tRNA(fMet)-specific endonuclease VapC